VVVVFVIGPDGGAVFVALAGVVVIIFLVVVIFGGVVMPVMVVVLVGGMGMFLSGMVVRFAVSYAVASGARQDEE